MSKTWNTEDSKQPEITKHDLTHEQGTWGGNRSLPTSTYILYILLFNYHPEVTAENQEKKTPTQWVWGSGIEPRACRIQSISAKRSIHVRVSHIHWYTVFDIPISDTTLITVLAALNPHHQPSLMLHPAHETANKTYRCGAISASFLTS